MVTVWLRAWHSAISLRKWSLHQPWDVHSTAGAWSWSWSFSALRSFFSGNVFLSLCFCFLILVSLCMVLSFLLRCVLTFVKNHAGCPCPCTRLWPDLDRCMVGCMACCHLPHHEWLNEQHTCNVKPGSFRSTADITHSFLRRFNATLAQTLLASASLPANPVTITSQHCHLLHICHAQVNLIH